MTPWNFSVQMKFRTRPDGSSYGSFKGLFHAPSYAPRGSFQGTWVCGK